MQVCRFTETKIILPDENDSAKFYVLFHIGSICNEVLIYNRRLSDSSGFSHIVSSKCSDLFLLTLEKFGCKFAYLVERKNYCQLEMMAASLKPCFICFSE